MNIIAEYIREKHKYSKSELIKVLHSDNESVSNIINHLKSCKIIREHNPKNRQFDDDYDPDDDREDTGETKYSFKFVGVISIGNVVIKCYPKYLFKYDIKEESLSPELELSLKYDLKNVFSVLLKYQKSLVNRLPTISEDPTNKPYELLPLMIYLLTDYFENGLYTSSKIIIESNGSGEIDWNRTINNNFAYIFKGTPYYLELKTRKRINDNIDFFRLLHQCILNKCSHDLSKEGIDVLELLDIPEVEFPYSDISDFGDDEYIIYRLQSELSHVFDSRRQELLKRMIEYVAGKFSLYDDKCFTFYGTTSFHMVWEEVCSEVFNNMLDKPLCEILPFLPDQVLTGEFSENCKKTLMELIGKPKWKLRYDPSFISPDDRLEIESDKFPDIEPDKTLEPDIVTIPPPKFTINNYEFTIFDAKYYCIRIKKNKDEKLRIMHQPGIGDITKQYLYQLAYLNFIQSYNQRNDRIMTAKNCFILPMVEYLSEENKKDLIYCGEVVFDMLQLFNLDIPLENISVYQVSANKIYSCYLNGEKRCISSEHTLEDLNKPSILPSTTSSQTIDIKN